MNHLRYDLKDDTNDWLTELLTPPVIASVAGGDANDSASLHASLSSDAAVSAVYLDDKPRWLHKFEDAIERQDQTWQTGLVPDIASRAVASSAVQLQTASPSDAALPAAPLIASADDAASASAIMRHAATFDATAGKPKATSMWDHLLRIVEARHHGVILQAFRIPWRQCLLGYDNISYHCREIAKKLIIGDGRVNYKIGIAMDVEDRYENRTFGYKLEGCFALAVLFATSNTVMAKDLERDLIAEFRDDSRCRNIAPGGEGISDRTVGEISVYIVFGGAAKKQCESLMYLKRRIDNMPFAYPRNATRIRSSA